MVAERSGRAIARTVLALLVLNGLFLLLIVLPLGDPTATRHRIRAAFESGDLGFDDFLLFDSRRGFFQYNDCNVLQMIANRYPSRLSGALSPIVYSADQDWTRQCAVLQRVAAERADLSGLIENHYSRYWHGYRVGVAMALRAMEIRTLRRMLGAAVWLSLAAFLVVTFRAAGATRRVGVAITLSAALFWAVPYFDQGFTFGFGDTALLFGLAVLAGQPHVARQVDTIAPFAAMFGAVIAFFEMLTGQLPVAAAWLVALAVAIRRDQSPSIPTDVRVLLFALAAFATGAVVTVVIKQMLAFALSDPGALSAFVSHLAMYADVPDASGRRPGILLPFIHLANAAYVLTYGRKNAGHVLVMLIALLWILGAALAWRDRRVPANMDRVVLLVASLAPVVWVLLLPQHTVIHARFMVRILIASVAVVPLAVTWPIPAPGNSPLPRVVPQPAAAHRRTMPPTIDDNRHLCAAAHAAHCGASHAKREAPSSLIKKPLLWSFASGLTWIGVASAMSYAVSPIHRTALDAAETFAGGIVAAPLVGLLVGHIARRFSFLSVAQRVALALADLYLATYLFLLATSVGHVARGWLARGYIETLHRQLVVDPLLGTILGLTHTGFVVVLLPLSYFNHVLIGKAWDRTAD